ncbi:uncharacterized protein METZ01_LOCUS158981, partial [marine metagenome]
SAFISFIQTTKDVDEVRKSELRTDGVIGTDLRKLVFEN